MATDSYLLYIHTPTYTSFCVYVSCYVTYFLMYICRYIMVYEILTGTEFTEVLRTDASQQSVDDEVIKYLSSM
ncbi:hypothetical protein EON63_22515 [archaeon]|nr:MAG: hypothetical protein EON63_22515 [archaeon]